MNKSKYLIIGILLLVIAGFIVSSITMKSPKSTNIEINKGNNKNISFKKEGTLHIKKMGGDTIVTIDIEVAGSINEKNQGLMYRQSLGGLQGMLFMFHKNKPQSFWMKNTYIPLDIIFIDENKRIVDQYLDAQPKSTKSIRSRRPAKYVLEVNAGFCRAYNIGPGMTVEFDID